MAKHQYRVTLERIADNHGDPVEGEKLEFVTENHDDIVQLAKRTGKTTDDELAFLVGLKLFGERLLVDKDNPLYSEFRPHFGAFMKALKGSHKGETPRS